MLEWFLGLVGLYYNITIDRKGICRVAILSAAHVFNYIVLIVNFGLISHEELPMPLTPHEQYMLVALASDLQICQECAYVTKQVQKKHIYMCNIT